MKFTDGFWQMRENIRPAYAVEYIDHEINQDRFCERIPVRDIAYYDGSDPVKMHNYYTVLYNKAVFDMPVRKRGIGEAVLFSRSSAVGGQQYPVHWGGDCSATYPSMAETEDHTAPYCETQYMFGDSLLVAPVFREDGKVR